MTEARHVRALVSSIAAPLAALIAAAAAVGCDAGPPGDDTRPNGCGRVPVLFVHGSGLTANSFAPMQEAFLEAGYPEEALAAVDMRPADGDNIAAASDFIAPAARALLEQQGRTPRPAGCEAIAPGKIDIVAHSMGAASSRWYATRLAPQSVRLLVTLAGANHGTNALCNRPRRGDRQMCPAFAPADDAVDGLQTELNGSRERPVDETPYGVGADSDHRIRVAPAGDRRIVYLTLRLQPDEWIKPANSAVLDGAGGLALPAGHGLPVTETGPGNFLYTAGASHDDLIREPAAIRLMLLLTRQADDQYGGGCRQAPPGTR